MTLRALARIKEKFWGKAYSPLRIVRFSGAALTKGVEEHIVKVQHR